MMFDARRGSLRETLFAAALLFVAGTAGCGDDSNTKSPPPVDAGTGSNPGQGFKDPAAAFATKTPIKHVVVIFGENISFDHYFGTYPHAANAAGETPFTAAANTPAANNLITPLDVNNHFAPLTGVNLMTANPNMTNTAVNGAAASNPFRLTPAQASTSDQNHDYTAEQNAYHGGAMDSFPKFTGAAPFAGETGVPTNTSMVMGYFDGNTVSALWGYAQKFAMNDNSWTTQFGPSTPGALNLIAGQTNGVTAPNNDFTQLAANTIDDGQGGKTLVGDIDPVGDKCSNAKQIQMSGKNVGDLLNAKNITWGSFMGGFDLTVTNANGSTGCTRSTSPTATPFAFTSVDYIPHHAWFQYYPSTANLTHARPSSVAAIGSSLEADGKTAEPANHGYDAHDFFEALAANNLPAVSFVKAPAFQDAHGGYSDPLDEQVFVTNVVNALQSSPFWSSTAIIIAYDDSDGWYDHQAPPIVNPSSLAAIGSPANVTDARDTLNGAAGCASTPAQQGVAVKTTAMNGLDGTKPVLGRCGYGTRMPFLVISPFAKTNFIDHTLTDQSSVLKFIEDNWLGGQRISTSSFDNIAGTIENMFSFPAGASKAELDALAESRKLILDPTTGR